MRRVLALVAVVGGLAVAGAAWWRRHPRFGARWVNRVVDPWLVRQGMLEESKGEIGLLEHVGRVSGTVRTTPVHPVPTPDGMRIVVPLGVESEWVKNVMAAGHCRIQVEGIIHELDEPTLVLPSAVEGLPRPATAVMEWLGFRYLTLHRFAEHPGELRAPEAEVEPRVDVAEASREAAPTT